MTKEERKGLVMNVFAFSDDIVMGEMWAVGRAWVLYYICSRVRLGFSFS